MTGGRAAPLLITATVALLAACAPDVVFVGDPVLEATVEPGSFEASIEEAVAQTGARSRVIWPQADSLEALDPQAVVAATDAPTVGLSPYLSLFAPSIADRFPDRTFVAFSSGPAKPNLTRVEFDATAAMREAGELLAAWVFDAGSRSATLLYDASRPAVAEHARALTEGYRRVAGVDLETERYASAPTREELRARLEALPVAGEVAVVALLGERTATLFDLARDEELLLAGRNMALPAREGRVLFSVRDDLALGLAEALGSPGGTLVVEAVLEASPATGPVE